MGNGESVRTVGSEKVVTGEPRSQIRVTRGCGASSLSWSLCSCP